MGRLPKSIESALNRHQTPRKAIVRSESDILLSVLTLLKARGIFAVRMNSGVLRNPTGRPVRFGVPGMADVLALVNGQYLGAFMPYWIECKREGGKQSPQQREFQAVVEAEGHRYLICRSAEDLLKELHIF